MKPFLSIVIPCLNEEKTIYAVVMDARSNAKKIKDLRFEIIVADNGSTDRTLKILKKIRFVKVIHVPIRGYGAALHWGITKSKGKYVLFADADLSYPFENLKVLYPKLKEEPDLLLGSRIKGYIEPNAMPFLNRYLGTPILTTLIRLIYRLPTSDCNSGMRIVKKKFYEELNMRNNGMEWASELLLKIALHGGKYMEAPIRFKKDARGKSPHLSRWSDGWRHLKAIILMKPLTLVFVLYLFILLFGLSLQFSFALAFLFYCLSIVIFLSLLTLKLLSFSIERIENPVSRFLVKFPLVLWSLIFTIIMIVIILYLPQVRLGTKMFLISTMSLIYIWLFLVETIKTHLINRLPDLN